MFRYKILVVEALEKGELDVGIDLFVTSKRLDLIDYAIPVLDAKYVFFAKKKVLTKDSNVFSFLFPLSKITWIGILASLIAIILFLFIIHRISKSKEDGNSSLHFIWLAFLTLCGFHEIHLSSKFKSVKLLQLSWSLFVFFVVSCYTANLAASLTIKKMNQEVLFCIICCLLIYILVTVL